MEDESEDDSESEDEDDAIVLAAEKILSSGGKAEGLPQKTKEKKKAKKTQVAKQSKIVEEIKLKKGWVKKNSRVRWWPEVRKVLQPQGRKDFWFFVDSRGRSQSKTWSLEGVTTNFGSQALQQSSETVGEQRGFCGVVVMF